MWGGRGGGLTKSMSQCRIRHVAMSALGASGRGLHPSYIYARGVTRWSDLQKITNSDLFMHILHNSLRGE